MQLAEMSTSFKRCVEIFAVTTTITNVQTFYVAKFWSNSVKTVMNKAASAAEYDFSKQKRALKKKKSRKCVIIYVFIRDRKEWSSRRGHPEIKKANIKTVLWVKDKQTDRPLVFVLVFERPLEQETPQRTLLLAFLVFITSLRNGR